MEKDEKKIREELCELSREELVEMIVTRILSTGPDNEDSAIARDKELFSWTELE